MANLFTGLPRKRTNRRCRDGECTDERCDFNRRPLARDSIIYGVALYGNIRCGGSPESHQRLVTSSSRTVSLWIMVPKPGALRYGNGFSSLSCLWYRDGRHFYCTGDKNGF